MSMTTTHDCCTFQFLPTSSFIYLIHRLTASALVVLHSLFLSVAAPCDTPSFFLFLFSSTLCRRWRCVRAPLEALCDVLALSSAVQAGTGCGRRRSRILNAVIGCVHDTTGRRRVGPLAVITRGDGSSTRTRELDVFPAPGKFERLRASSETPGSC